MICSQDVVIHISTNGNVRKTERGKKAKKSSHELEKWREKHFTNVSEKNKGNKNPTNKVKGTITCN